MLSLVHRKRSGANFGRYWKWLITFGGYDDVVSGSPYQKRSCQSRLSEANNKKNNNGQMEKRSLCILVPSIGLLLTPDGYVIYEVIKSNEIKAEWLGKYGILIESRASTNQ
jgi:hypothetical protein